jgi:hypothetical protein
MQISTPEKPIAINVESLIHMNKRQPHPERVAYVKACFEYLINHKETTSIKFLRKLNAKEHMVYPSGGMHGDPTKRLHRIWIVLTIADPPKPKKVISFDEQSPHGKINRELFGDYSHRLSSKSWFCLRLEGQKDGTYKAVEGKSKFKIIKINGQLKVSGESLDTHKQSSDLKYFRGEADEEAEALQQFERCVEFIINNPELPIKILKPIDEDSFMTYPMGGLRPKGRKTTQAKRFMAYIRLLPSNGKSKKSDPLISFIGDTGDGNKEHFLEGTFTDKLTVPNHQVVIQLKRVDGIYFIDRYRILQGIKREGDKLILLPLDSISDVQHNLQDDMDKLLGAMTGVSSQNSRLQKKREKEFSLDEDFHAEINHESEMLYIDVTAELVSKAAIPSDHKVMYRKRYRRVWVEITDDVTPYQARFTSNDENRSWFAYLLPIKIHRPRVNRYLLETTDLWTRFKIIESVPASKIKKHRQADE